MVPTKDMSEKNIYVQGEDFVQKPKTQKVAVEINFALSYESRYKYTSRLRSVWSSKYFDWIVTQLNDQNETYVGIRSEKQFAESLRKIGVAPPSSRTMKDVMKELVAEKLLLRIGWGQYKVNPLVVWKGQSTKRIEEIKHLTAVGLGLQANVDVLPQNIEKVQPSALSSSRDENSQEIIIEEVAGDENPQAADNKEVI